MDTLRYPMESDSTEEVTAFGSEYGCLRERGVGMFRSRCAVPVGRSTVMRGVVPIGNIGCSGGLIREFPISVSTSNGFNPAL